MKLIGISGTIVGSKTEVAIKKTLEGVDSLNSGIETEFVNLKDYNLNFCDGRDPSNYDEDTKKIIHKICEADCYVIGTPIFQGSIPGALKNLFDLLPTDALKHKVIGFIATGGTFQHYLVVENQLRPIASYFRSFVAPGYVYLNDTHFNERKEINDEDALRRLDELAKELVFMQSRLKKEAVISSKNN